MNESNKNQTNIPENQTPVVDHEEAEIIAEAMEIINTEKKNEEPKPVLEENLATPVETKPNLTDDLPTTPEPASATFVPPTLDENGKIAISKKEPEKKVDPILPAQTNDLELKSLKAQNEYLKKGYNFDDETWNDIAKLVDHDFKNSAKIEKYLNVLSTKKETPEQEPTPVKKVTFQPRTTEYGKQESGKFKLKIGF